MNRNLLKYAIGLSVIAFVIAQIFKDKLANSLILLFLAIGSVIVLILDKKKREMTSPARGFMLFIGISTGFMSLGTYFSETEWAIGILTPKVTQIGFPLLFVILIFIFGMISNPEFKRGTPLFKQIMGALLIIGLLLLNFIIFLAIRK